jgi:hypothetical protein
MDCRCNCRDAQLPVIRGPHWFGSVPGSLIVRIDVPLPFDEVVAVLHGIAQPDDLLTDEDLVGCVAVTLLLEGLPGLEARAAKVCEDEGNDAVESPAFLSHCRERVSRLLAS